jgi:hypothetical protein
MAKMTELEMLQALRDFDTPSITNVVATYPANPFVWGFTSRWKVAIPIRHSLYVPGTRANGRLCGNLCLRPP